MPLSAGDLEVEQDRASAVLPHYPDLARKTPRLRRGKLLISREAVVELIASTTTRAGLTVRCELDTRDYPKGIKVSDAEMNFRDGDYGAAEYFPDSQNDRHISDSRSVHGG